ncbi:hypothetical protein GCM10022200_06840 [Microbacterium awajiense]|uniref:Uncharacterized protein n=1 Tax=Microbacterium awajiense TaxID=415214 RepID=A0ABP7A8K8_9MICO
MTRAAAWSVPAIAVAAAVPAYAASGAAGSITGRCRSGVLADFDVVVTQADLGTSIQIVLQHSGDGSFGVTAPNGWVLANATASSYTYIAPTLNGALSGTVVANYNLGQNGVATVTATISALSGTPLAGDLSAAVSKRRNGNSDNYMCSVVG